MNRNELARFFSYAALYLVVGIVVPLTAITVPVVHRAALPDTATCLVIGACSYFASLRIRKAWHAAFPNTRT